MTKKGKYKPVKRAKEINDLLDPHDPEGMIAMMSQYFESRRINNYSEATLSTHKYYLRYFVNWLAARGVTRPVEVTRPMIERYRRYLYYYRKRNGNPLSFESQNERVLVVRVWFRWMVRNNRILYNPAADIELPRIADRLPKHVLTASEAEAVINRTDVADPLGIRDRAILETFYSTAMRRIELVRLRPSDVDVERGIVLIRQGKGKKDRMVPIGKRALAWIERYQVEVRPNLLVGERADDALFLSHLGKPFRPNQMSQLVRDYIIAADTGKEGSCHLFRHTAATLMHDNGASIRYVQQLLGHSSLESTQIYTRVSIRRLKEVHTKTHPARLDRKADDEE